MSGYSRGLAFAPGYVGIAVAGQPRTVAVAVWCSGYGPREGYEAKLDPDNPGWLVNCTHNITKVPVPNGGRYWGGGGSGDPTSENPIANGLDGVDPDNLMVLEITVTPSGGGAPAGQLNLIATKTVDGQDVTYASATVVISGGVEADLILDTYHGPDGALYEHSPDTCPDPTGYIAGYHGTGAYGHLLQGDKLVAGGNAGQLYFARLFAGRHPHTRILIDAVRRAAPGGALLGLVARASGVPGNTDAGQDCLAAFLAYVDAANVELRWERIAAGGIVEGPTALAQFAWAIDAPGRLILEFPAASGTIRLYRADAVTGANEALLGTAAPGELWEDALHEYVGILLSHYTDCWEITRLQVVLPHLVAGASAVGWTMVESAAPPAAADVPVEAVPVNFPAGNLVASIVYHGGVADWLTLAFADAVTPTSLAITPTAAVSGFYPGTYTATITLTSDLGGAPVTADVTLIVTDQPGQPCELRLDLFEEDGSTVAWNVSSAAAHPRPFLVEPEKYEEQKLDMAACTASIGTVTVTVIDRAQVAGDQDSGWLTERLATPAGVPAIAGRRCRLRRYVLGVGWRVVADGPAGQPKLDSSYAAYSWEIRDVRDTERKLRAFDDGAVSGLTVLPEGDLDGYGYDPASGTYLVDPTTPAIGVVTARNGLNVPGLPGGFSVNVGFGADVGRGEPYPVIYDASWRAMQGDVTALELLAVSDNTFELLMIRTWAVKWHARVNFGGRLRLRWRPYPGGGAWHELSTTLVIDQEWCTPPDLVPSHNWPGLAACKYPGPDTSIDGLPHFSNVNYQDIQPIELNGLVANGPPNAQPGEDGLPVHWLVFGDSSDAGDVPGIGDTIELVVLASGPPSEAQPIIIEGITAGEFARNAYDGLYSARDPDGSIVPSGIRYVEADLLQMTTPVRLRITEPIDDVRQWLEEKIYQPLGWVPALDTDGYISPVSQVPPTSADGLPLFTDANCEPAPDWEAGDQVVNLVRFTYPRDYKPADPKDAKASDGVNSLDVVVEYQDVASIAALGEQQLEIDGLAFRALSSDSIGGTVDLASETGWQLALDRQRLVGARYVRGAPAIAVKIMQEEFPTLRAGDWVILQVSWLPDYLTGRRGLLSLAQVIGLGDLDCAWRVATIEYSPVGES